MLIGVPSTHRIAIHTLLPRPGDKRGAGHGPEGEERKTKEANRGQVTGAHLEEHPPGLLGTHGTPGQTRKARPDARAGQGDTRQGTEVSNGRGAQSQKLGGEQDGCKMGPSASLPQASTNSGFQEWEDGGGRWAKRALSSGHSVQVLGRTAWGRGRKNDLEPSLAAAFYSTLPRINCPKTSSITKKATIKTLVASPLSGTSSAIFPSAGDRVAWGWAAQVPP